MARDRAVRLPRGAPAYCRQAFLLMAALPSLAAFSLSATGHFLPCSQRTVTSARNGTPHAARAALRVGVRRAQWQQSTMTRDPSNTGLSRRAAAVLSGVAFQLLCFAPACAASYTDAELEEALRREKLRERPQPRKVTEVDEAGAIIESFLPPINTAHSSRQALALGKHLADIGARMYGGYACSHCYQQKQILGREVLEILTYVECGKGGANAQRALCKEQKGVKRFPTWEINGQMYEGEKSLERLAQLAQFDLPR